MHSEIGANFRGDSRGASPPLSAVSASNSQPVWSRVRRVRDRLGSDLHRQRIRQTLHQPLAIIPHVLRKPRREIVPPLEQAVTLSRAKISPGLRLAREQLLLP